MVDKVEQTDILVLLRYLNASFGMLDTENRFWEGVIGMHGRSERNAAGEELLQFCSINQLTIMNTWYQMKGFTSIRGCTREQKSGI